MVIYISKDTIVKIELYPKNHCIHLFVEKDDKNIQEIIMDWTYETTRLVDEFMEQKVDIEDPKENIKQYLKYKIQELGRFPSTMVGVNEAYQAYQLVLKDLGDD